VYYITINISATTGTMLKELVILSLTFPPAMGFQAARGGSRAGSEMVQKGEKHRDVAVAGMDAHSAKECAMSAQKSAEKTRKR
jgi:hypothetical protein